MTALALLISFVFGLLVGALVMWLRIRFPHGLIIARAPAPERLQDVIDHARQKCAGNVVPLRRPEPPGGDAG